MKLHRQIKHTFFRFKENSIKFEMLKIFSMADLTDAEYENRCNISQLLMRRKIPIFTHLYASLTKQTIVQNEIIWRVKRIMLRKAHGML